MYYLTPNCTGEISNYVSSSYMKSRLLGQEYVIHSRTQFDFLVSNRRVGVGFFFLIKNFSYIGNFITFEILLPN